MNNLTYLTEALKTLTECVNLKESDDYWHLSTRTDDILDKCFTYFRDNLMDPKEFYEFAKNTLDMSDEELAYYCDIRKEDIEESLTEALKTLTEANDELTIEEILDNSLRTGNTFSIPDSRGLLRRIHDWAESNNINLVTINAAALDMSDLTGVSDRNGQYYRSTVFDGLEKPNSVLLVDGMDRVDDDIRRILLRQFNSLSNKPLFTVFVGTGAIVGTKLRREPYSTLKEARKTLREASIGDKLKNVIKRSNNDSSR